MTYGVTRYGRRAVVEESDAMSVGGGSIYGQCAADYPGDFVLQELCVQSQEGSRDRVNSGTAGQRSPPE